MKRWMYQYEPVHGTPEHLERVLRSHVRDLLATVTDGDNAELTAEGDFMLRLPGHVLGLDLHKMVRLHTGVAEQRGSRTCIPLHWHAEPGKHAFPSFEGMIEFEPQSTSTAHLSIVGAANLPLGPVGFAADATALGSVADRTVRHLSKGLAAALERAATLEPEEKRIASQYQLLVRDVMTSHPLVFDEDMPLKTAALLLFHYDVAGAPVRTATDGLAGVLSEADLLDSVAPRRYGSGREVDESRRRRAARTVGEACSRPACEVTPTAAVRDAAALMREQDIARLVVVDDSEIVGVVSRHDVLKAFLRTDVEVQTALDQMLAQRDEDEVMASVQWGIAHLTGRVSTRTNFAVLLDLVDDLDGVVGVDADLTWKVDDVIPPPTPML